MNDLDPELIAFLTARLDEAMARAEDPIVCEPIAGKERTLREVAAKRAIVKRCALVLESFGHPGPRQTFRHLSRREHSHAVETLRLLAAIDCDHPDYQERWKP